MVQSLEILLDDALEGQVLMQWGALTAAELPSQGRHTGETNRPHVTLAVATSLPPDAEEALGAVAGSLPLPLRLGGLLCFSARNGSRVVLARLVVPSGPLLALHAAAAAVFDPLPGAPANLRPGAWTAHVTLARNLPTARLGEAVAALGPVTEAEGEAVALRRWDSDAREAWVVEP